MESTGGYGVDGEGLQMLLFADDIVLVAGDPEKLQKLQNELSNKAKKIGLSIHDGKTKSMKNAFCPQLTMKLDEIREFLLDYAQYNITLFDYDSSIFDLITTVKKEMAKTVLITLCCMACVCFAFTPNILVTSIATLSILSISCTLLGMLGWWNLDIDPITMISVLMAVGFSVDFSAHTCYHFHKYALTRHAIPPRSDEKVAKLAHIFNAIGNPLIEVSILFRFLYFSFEIAGLTRLI
ncbi:unnamed protein product [Toxocara canis]|uniref:Reverse transcriptase domain-containing protein n=1 Tax=Toxocara canis TaxID=6265 RepID=A0A183U1A6_TOXCA|nr:unnamed protein product [Toxocara canis]